MFSAKKYFCTESGIKFEFYFRGRLYAGGGGGNYATKNSRNSGFVFVCDSDVCVW